MSKRFTYIFLLLLLLSITGCLRPFPAEGIPTPPPELVPARTVQQAENISLLWVKDIELNDPHKVYVEFFTPGEQSVVFWHPETKTIVSLDMATGETLWESEVPDHGVIRLHEEKFFVTSYEWLETLEIAPIKQNRALPDCSFGGRASLLIYDPYSGERIWGYVYEGVDSFDIFFQGPSVYLTGSGDHGSSQSIAKIDAASGELLGRECYKWPDKTRIPRRPHDEGITNTPYSVIFDEEDLEWRQSSLFFVAQGTRLNILDGVTKEVPNYIEFDGAQLNPWDIDVAIQDDLIVIYLNDSNQLFGFRS